MYLDVAMITDMCLDQGKEELTQYARSLDIDFTQRYRNMRGREKEAASLRGQRPSAVKTRLLHILNP